MTPQLQPLIDELHQLRREMLALVEEHDDRLDTLHPDHKASARNLLHYLALRRHDLHDLQDQLASLGLSSLGRTEAQVLPALDSVLCVLHQLQKIEPFSGSTNCTRASGRKLLANNTYALLGPAPEGRRVRIMVTMPSEAATSYPLVRDLVERGMNCMRVNCAHDSPLQWQAMIRHLRMAERDTGRTCKVLMDLSGPKLRTGSLPAGSGVVKVRPVRNAEGLVERPARLWLTPTANPTKPPQPADAVIPISQPWLHTLQVGNCVHFTDTRGAKRTLRITALSGNGRWAESDKTIYIKPGMEWTANRKGAYVGQLSTQPPPLLLRTGDELSLIRSDDPQGQMQISVPLAEFFESVKEGEPIFFDDGKIGGMIKQVSADEVKVEITQARPNGSKLAGEKGINVPETDLRTPSLSEEDIQALAFAKQHADMVGYSFVRTVQDIRALENELGDSTLGVVLKIETRQAFDNLPELLLAAMKRASIGVMIARGDLAIECGFERLAEIQEEILWFAEAAHIPVIWATQVLESLAKTGTPSRSEITDAAMGERAECVMLNKGEYISEALRSLDDILRRMQAHSEKKSARMRRLNVATEFSPEPEVNLHEESLAASG